MRDPHCYEDCAALLNTARDITRGKPIANNTRIFPRTNASGNSDMAIRLHNTDVLTFHTDGTMTLDSGGWRTVTTKERLNRYLPTGLNVWSDRGTWKLYSGDYPDRRVAAEFFDGMRITPEGEVLNGIPQEEMDAYHAEKARVEREVKGYIDGFLDALRSEEGLPLPSGGDCWYCALVTEDGQAMGDIGADPTHLWDHIRESYYVPSLLYNAIVEERYGNPKVVFTIRYVVFDGDTPIKLRERADRASTRRTLRKYLLKRLLPEPPSQVPHDDPSGPRTAMVSLTPAARGLR